MPILLSHSLLKPFSSFLSSLSDIMFPLPLFLGAAIFTFACMMLCSLRFVRINASRTHNTHMHTLVRPLFLVTFFPAL